jgi:nucleoside-diphosphate-sugar epimerase
MNTQTITVVGANGFIGSRLIAEALLNKTRVIGLARKKRKQGPEKRVFAELEDNLSPEQMQQYRENLTIYDYDMNEPQIGLSDAALKDILDSSRNIFNCVGDTTFFPRDKEKLFDTNINGPASLVEVLCRNKAVFHHVSTAYVSGSRSGVILESELDVGQRFKNPYEESKCLGEKKVHEICAQQAVPYNVFRPSIVIRKHAIPGKTPHLNHFYLFFSVMDTLHRDIEAQTTAMDDGYYHVPVRFLGSTKSTLNFVDLDFCCQALFHIGMNRHDGNKTYHLTNPRPMLNEDFMNAIMEIYKIKGFTALENRADFTDLNAHEKMIQTWLSNYIDYFYVNPVFDTSNVLAGLQGTAIAHPAFNQAYIARAIGRL